MSLLFLLCLLGFLFDRATATDLLCIFHSECPGGSFCDLRSGGFCKRQYYSSCSDSAHCDSYASCLKVHEKSEVVEYSSTSTTSPNDPCLGAPMEDKKSHCDSNTVLISSYPNRTSYCVPCSYFARLNIIFEKNICRRMRRYKGVPSGSKGSTFNSCYSTSDCDDSIQCVTLSNDHISTPQYSESANLNFFVCLLLPIWTRRMNNYHAMQRK